eukprot:COSAG02_NODE_25110_length_668_cov_64.376098_2_plen_29_part_01
MPFVLPCFLGPQASVGDGALLESGLDPDR